MKEEKNDVDMNVHCYLYNRLERTMREGGRERKRERENERHGEGERERETGLPLFSGCVVKSSL